MTDKGLDTELSRRRLLAAAGVAGGAALAPPLATAAPGDDAFRAPNLPVP